MATTEIAAWVTAVGGICTALGALIGVFIKTQTDAYVKRKQADTDAAKILSGVHHGECAADDERADRAYGVVIALHEKRIAVLEGENNQCRKENAELRESLAVMRAELNHVKRKLEGRTG